MPKVTLEACQVLQFESRPYTGKLDGKPKQARSMVLKYKGKMFTFSVDAALTDEAATALAGKKADIELEMSTFGSSLDATFRVAGVATKK